MKDSAKPAKVAAGASGREPLALRAALIYLVGLVDIVTTLLPAWPWRLRLLLRFSPVALTLAAQHATLFAGIGLLLLAWPAAQGQRRAASLLMACGLVAVVANLLERAGLSKKRSSTSYWSSRCGGVASTGSIFLCATRSWTWRGWG